MILTRLNGDGPLVVVEDHEIDREVMARAHRRSLGSNELLLFHDGQAFLDYMQGHPDGPPMPAMILLDINMPGIDGFTVLQELRADPRFNDVPTAMFYTTSNRLADKQRASQLNASFQEKFDNAQDRVSFLNGLVA